MSQPLPVMKTEETNNTNFIGNNRFEDLLEKVAVSWLHDDSPWVLRRLHKRIRHSEAENEALSNRR